MKSIPLTLVLLVISTNLFSTEKKWIPIEPIDLHEKRKIDTNVSKPQAGNKLLQNVKIIQQLLDKSRANPTDEPVKSWFSLDETEND